MALLFKLNSIVVAFLLLLACANGDGASSLRKPQDQKRNLATKVKICYKGVTKIIYRRRLSYFLGLGATRGACPDVVCPADAKLCWDGSYVSRNPNRNCTFYPCPPKPCCDPSTEPGTNGLPLCIEGHACCPDGTWTCSIGDAKTFPCGGKLITSGFGKKCPADPVVCPLYLILCPDGSSVGPNPDKNCAVDPCPPACCDPALQPGVNGNPICFEGAACCPDGSWSCSIGDGKTFPCGGELTTTDFGKPCAV